ncbi:phage tail protein [Persicobacter psychrovividus]|uniref:Phage tail protein n=1 Tax=Persicobacter psychrovividus TaxID=387638 RepID=A0ABM7VK39_9BACT|nr:hypothetical protein PEPS_36270 [Persicobacter psychrovividus]
MWNNPNLGFHFIAKVIDPVGSITLGNKFMPNESDARFSEISGLEADVITQEIIEGGENRFTYQVPSAIKYSPLVLKRGKTSQHSALAAWCSRTLDYGLIGVELKHIVIMLLNEHQEPVNAWICEYAYPKSWKVSSFNAMENNIVVESMEFVYRKFQAIPIS